MLYLNGELGFCVYSYFHADRQGTSLLPVLRELAVLSIRLVDAGLHDLARGPAQLRQRLDQRGN
jgi:hypothetical protein